jgi:hypothetical protein
MRREDVEERKEPSSHLTVIVHDEIGFAILDVYVE